MNGSFVVILLLACSISGCEQVQPALEPGTVLAAVPTDQASENMGIGAAAGAVAGGLGGAQIGAGAGQVVATVAGVVAGAAVGNALESASKSHDGVAYTVRLSDGRVVTVIEHVDQGDPIFGPGTPVVLQTSGSSQIILSR
jgi:outer membrane lipoprotein SlyB